MVENPSVYPFEKVVFNSDMLNDEKNMYFDFNDQTHGFGFIKWPISGCIMDSLHAVFKKFSNYSHHPQIVFIPFKCYQEEVEKHRKEDERFGDALRQWVEYYGLQLFIMTPDYLKDNVRI